MRVQVDIWSDVICPWCYVGKRRLESALNSADRRDEVRIKWHSFELDPTAPLTDDRSMTEVLAKKYQMTEEQAEESQARLTGLAAAEGIELHLDRTRRSNTFDAHRLLHLAESVGLGNAMKERLLAAYFSEGRRVSDHAELVALAEDVGLDRSAVSEMLQSDQFASDVRADEQEAARLGATGVPFFVIDGRYAISGAQDSALFAEVLDRAWRESPGLNAWACRAPDG